MEPVKNISIAIIMLIPSFVFGGAAWDLFGSWTAVFFLEIIMVLIYFSIITGKLSSLFQKE